MESPLMKDLYPFFGCKNSWEKWWFFAS